MERKRDKVNRERSKSSIPNKRNDRNNKNSKYKDKNNNKIIKEQQKISTEWMKISKEKDIIDKEKMILKKEKLKLNKEKTEIDKQSKILNQEKKNLQILYKKWKQESKELTKQIKEKYSSFTNLEEKNDNNTLINDQYIEERRSSLTNHVDNLQNIATNLPSSSIAESQSNDINNLDVDDNNNNNNKRNRARSRTRSRSNAPTPINQESGDIQQERIKLQRMQNAAKVCTQENILYVQGCLYYNHNDYIFIICKESQKRAEKTLKELYRKKQEFKKEQSQFENDRKKFKRMENEYNEFIKEKQRLKNEKKQLRDKKKFLSASEQKKSKLQLLEANKLADEKDRVEKSKNILQHKKGLLSAQSGRISAANLSALNVLEQKREFKDMKKKVIMYQDQIEKLENQNKILQRKIKKRDKFANDFAQDMNFGNKSGNNMNTKYLISTLRSKVIELQNKNKLLTKLIKRNKNINDAYNSVSDLKTAKKIITKLVIQNDELNKRINVLNVKIQRMKDLGDKYKTKLYKIYDDDDDDDDDEEKELEFNLETMEISELNSLYDSMKQKISELLLKTEDLETKLLDKETELLQFESYANEWDIKQRLGQDRDKALYGKLRIENEKLQNKLDLVFQNLEKEKAAALTWQNTIEDKLLQSDNIQVGDDEKLLLINQLKEENKKLQTKLSFNNDKDIKSHKSIAMDINEQFGSALLNNLQYILMDANLNNDDILKLKIKDKNDKLYNVVLIKQNDDEKSGKDDIIKPIVSEERNMVNKMENIQTMINKYDERMQRIISMLGHIKNSRKLLKWNAIDKQAKGQKGQFDLVVSELREINVDTAPQSPASPSSIINQQQKKITWLSPTNSLKNERHQRTLRKFVKNRSGGRSNRAESMESLDSVYDLSYEDNLARYGMSYEVKLL